MKARGATLGVKPFARMKSAGAALRLFACLAALCISVIAPSESFATPASSPSCATGVGVGGQATTLAASFGGNGCVVIQYSSGGTTYYDTINYAGFNQTWTVPTGVSSVIFHALGAGGGGGRT